MDNKGTVLCNNQYFKKCFQTNRFSHRNYMTRRFNSINVDIYNITHFKII